MRRKEIRTLKRAIISQNNVGAMEMLLHRSVRFGHKKLALLRCIQAEKMGICIASEVLSYCRKIADGMPNTELQKIMEQSSRLAVAGGMRSILSSKVISDPRKKNSYK